MKITIDTTISKQATVTLTEKDVEIVSQTGSDALKLVAQILDAKKLRIEDVDFELKNQPGSYTGLKIGASLVNTFNFIKGKSTIIIPNYQTDSGQ